MSLRDEIKELNSARKSGRHEEDTRINILFIIFLLMLEQYMHNAKVIHRTI